MISSQKLYDKVDKLRRERGLTQNKLSDMAGISHGTLNSWKSRGTMPKLEVIEGLCDALQISPVYLLYGHDFENLTDEELELLNLWKGINQGKRKAILYLIRAIVEQ